MNTYYNLSYDVLEQINKNKTPCVIIVNSSKDLHYTILAKIKNENVKFIIKSALGDEKYYNNADTKYKKRTEYSLKQTKKIIQKLEFFDKKIPKKINDFEKCAFIYKKLINKIKYEDSYTYKENVGDIRRTLYCIVTKKAVCSGYALLLYEILKRNSINNYYMHSKNHLFNVIEINNCYYPVDSTWEAVLKNKSKDNLLHFFGNYPLFEETHILSENEPVFKYSFFESYSLYNGAKKLKTYNFIRNDKSEFFIAQLPIGRQLKYYAYYSKNDKMLCLLASKQDFTKVWHGDDKILKDCYINCLLDHNRIKRKINTSIYIGYGEIKNNSFYKKNICEEQIDIQSKINDNKLEITYKNIKFNVIFKNKKFIIRGLKND